MEKKIYLKPELEVTPIDNNISLVMMTDYENPPTEPLGNVEVEKTTIAPTQQNPYDENVFQ
ncbi:hypothetical protein [Plebeiibacterium sediminum]|uniref:Uncharacterized protein n=1 Tax=Plebeiibacterium sediminum TaxID=2992112 RepID=A0AAE3SE25_9BACT|nr:hypothetical protein [Plebeiobacterium sediminum]MCW3785731.1 hypothetical protein [Plebeiobacterium sediminum]